MYENMFRAGDGHLLSTYSKKKCWNYIHTVKSYLGDLEFTVQCERSELF